MSDHVIEAVGLTRYFGDRPAVSDLNLTVPKGCILLWWCLLDLPARQPCSWCGKPRVVNRVSCEHCLASFPAPALDGTEIFT
jgi:hypothetical protein